ncbi:hypothetical protein HZB01_03095 [Candidatus Woesearchaeota archaeon]|nr:hypothetical protein [Candidatus Woesearchaeota archaeon]
MAPNPFIRHVLSAYKKVEEKDNAHKKLEEQFAVLQRAASKKKDNASYLREAARMRHMIASVVDKEMQLHKNQKLDHRKVEEFKYRINLLEKKLAKERRRYEDAEIRHKKTVEAILSRVEKLYPRVAHPHEKARVQRRYHLEHRIKKAMNMEQLAALEQQYKLIKERYAQILKMKKKHSQVAAIQKQLQMLGRKIRRFKQN